MIMMTYHYHATPARTRGWPRRIYEQLAKHAVQGRGLIGGLPATVPRRTADGWVIDGTKIYSTGSTGLDWFWVWAKTDEETPRVGNFLVRSDSPGVAIEQAWDHLGMRATVSHAMHFTATPVPFDHAVDIRLPEQWAAGAGDPRGGDWAGTYRQSGCQPEKSSGAPLSRRAVQPYPFAAERHYPDCGRTGRAGELTCP